MYAEELAQSQAELDTEEQKLMSYIEELKRLGVEFKGPDGLCDFYSMMDGREVFLCWRLGEAEVVALARSRFGLRRSTAADGACPDVQ